jgi:hypothetical protein
MTISGTINSRGNVTSYASALATNAVAERIFHLAVSPGVRATAARRFPYALTRHVVMLSVIANATYQKRSVL